MGRASKKEGHLDKINIGKAESLPGFTIPHLNDLEQMRRTRQSSPAAQAKIMRPGLRSLALGVYRQLDIQ